MTVTVTVSPAWCLSMMTLMSCGIGDLLAVDSDDQVTAEHDRLIANPRLFVSTAQSGPIGGATGDYFLNQHTIVRSEAHLVSKIRSDGVRDDAQ